MWPARITRVAQLHQRPDALICPFISECRVRHQSDCFVSIPAFIYAASKVASVCVWYWSWGAVRYESSWLNPSAVRNMTCHRGTAPSSSAGHMYYRSAGVMTRLAFVLLLLFLYIFILSPVCVLPLRHQSSLSSSFIEIEVLITAQADLELTKWSAFTEPPPKKKPKT